MHFARSIIVAAGLVAPLVTTACAGVRAEAPFAAGPGTVERGDLRGPFDGQVLDADAGKPVPGAVVQASWQWRSGVGVSAPAGAHTELTQTDADGRYSVDALAASRSGRLARFTLVVYKRGYVSYRSDRRFDDLAPRADFVQRGNVVKLERFPTDGSRIKHVSFIGPGGPLLAELGWELQQASEEARVRAAQEAEKAAPKAEPAPEPEPAAPPRPALDASQLLTVDELRAATGYRGEFSLGKLGDLPTTPEYDTAYFKAIGKPEKFDAAVRVARAPDAEEAEAQYDEMIKQFPAVVEKNEVGDRSLRSRQGELLGMAALDRQRALIVVLSCGASLCKDGDKMAALFKRMWPRLDKVLAGRPETPAPAAPAPENKPLKLRAPEIGR